MGQSWLYKINGRNYFELFVGFEQLTSDLMIVISSERVVVFELVKGSVVHGQACVPARQRTGRIFPPGDCHED